MNIIILYVTNAKDKMILYMYDVYICVGLRDAMNIKMLYCWNLKIYLQSIRRKIL